MGRSDGWLVICSAVSVGAMVGLAYCGPVNVLQAGRKSKTSMSDTTDSPGDLNPESFEAKLRPDPTPEITNSGVAPDLPRLTKPFRQDQLAAMLPPNRR